MKYMPARSSMATANRSEWSSRSELPPFGLRETRLIPRPYAYSVVISSAGPLFGEFHALTGCYRSGDNLHARIARRRSAALDANSERDDRISRLDSVRTRCGQSGHLELRGIGSGR